MPSRESEPVLPVLPELDDDPFQVFDPGAEEPIAPLEPLDDLARAPDPLFNAAEPVGTWIELPTHDADPYATLDDLEDFATQEQLPCLPWSLEASILESALTLPAVLEPTLPRTLLEQPGAVASIKRLTVRIRMVQVLLDVQVQDGPRALLRVGRDVLAGRILVRIDE